MFKLLQISLIGLLLFTVGCSSTRQFSRGEFEDTQRVNLLSDKFSESTAQLLSKTVIDKLKACPNLDPNKPSPYVAIERIDNSTEEMVDLKMVSNQVRTALIRSGKFRFIDKHNRNVLEDEYQYNDTGVVGVTSKKVRGNQIGADLVLVGTLSSVVQEVGHDKTVYYQLDVNLTNVNTGVIDCVADAEARTVFQKNKEPK